MLGNSRNMLSESGQHRKQEAHFRSKAQEGRASAPSQWGDSLEFQCEFEFGMSFYTLRSCVLTGYLLQIRADVSSVWLNVAIPSQFSTNHMQFLENHTAWLCEELCEPHSAWHTHRLSNITSCEYE